MAVVSLPAGGGGGRCDDAGLLEGDLGPELDVAHELEPIDVLGRRPEVGAEPDAARLQGLDQRTRRRVGEDPVGLPQGAIEGVDGASAVDASLGITTSKLLRKLGEAVALTMISLKIVALGIRTCFPSSVTSTVARVFSDLTRPPTGRRSSRSRRSGTAAGCPAGPRR